MRHYQLLSLLSVPFGASRSLNVRQTDGQPYCGAGEKPKADSCHSAIGLINTASGFYNNGDEFRYGDCSVIATGGGSGSGSISGQTFVDLANKVLDNCDVLGWVYDGSVNVSISQCTVCGPGACTVCNSPGQGPLKKRDLPNVAMTPTILERAPPSKVEAAVKRDETPFPGMICGAGGAAHVDSCMELADILQGMGKVPLPFTTAHAADGTVGGDLPCQFALEPTNGNTEDAESTHVGQMLRDITDLCKDPQGEYVGRMQNTHGFDYEMFAGNLCGRFGFGNANCVP